MDAELLSRIQFAVTAGFHFLFPPITIGLAWMLVVIETRSLRTGEAIYDQIGRLFAKLLGLTFAVGVATGIVMEFQFGTNWERYSKFVGDIFGAPLAAEGVLAFFLESTFLGLYLFARDRISKRAHWFSALMVAVGSTLSAFWIIVANSWMQTPAGYHVVALREGIAPWVQGMPLDPSLYRAELTSFWGAVFNPSTILRYCHTVTAALVCGSFFMAGTAAYLVLRNSKPGFAKADPSVLPLAKKAMVVSLVVGLISAVLVGFPFGHHHAKQVAQLQPEKFAAIEGLYSSKTGAPLVMFAIPMSPPPQLKAKVEIPKMLSWMAFGDINAHIKGLNEFPKENHPPLWMTFVSFHNMVVLGMFFIVATAYGLLLFKRGKLFESRRFLWLLVWSIPLPLAACQLGWITAEVGRQPWIVYGVMRTRDAFSAGVPAGQILFSLILFTLIYTLLGALYVYLLFHKLNHATVETAKPGKSKLAAV